MVVSIDFCGMQRVVTQKNSIEMPLVEKTRVADALEFVRNQYPDLHLDVEMVLITVNQKKASLDRVLQANDTVSFPPPSQVARNSPVSPPSRMNSTPTANQICQHISPSDAPHHPGLEVELEDGVHAHAKVIAQVDVLHAEDKKRADGAEEENKVGRLGDWVAG